MRYQKIEVLLIFNLPLIFCAFENILVDLFLIFKLCLNSGMNQLGRQETYHFHYTYYLLKNKDNFGMNFVQRNFLKFDCFFRFAKTLCYWLKTFFVEIYKTLTENLGV